MNVTIAHNLSAGLALNPVVTAGLTLLTQTRTDLQLSVSTAVQNNPFLTFVESCPDGEDDWGFVKRSDEEPPSLENYSEGCWTTADLQQELEEQLNDIDPSPARLRLCLAWIDELDEHGRLAIAAQEFGVKYNTSRPEAEAALMLCRTLQPRGLFAYSIYECFILQLGNRPDVATFVGERLAEILELGIARYCKLHRVDIETVWKYLNIVRRLRRTFHVEEKVVATTAEAEIVIEREKIAINWIHDFEVQAINWQNRHASEEMLRQWTDAQAMVRMLRQRRDTIRQVITTLVEKQEEFIRTLDMTKLKPLSHADIGDIVTLHATTIGRAVANKSIIIRGKPFRLSELFSTRVDASTATKAIRQMVADMLKKHPGLTDANVAYLLQQKGIDISRRGVTKYRIEMSIATKARRNGTARA